MERQVRVVRDFCTGCDGVKRKFEMAEVYFGEDGKPDSKFPICLKSDSLYDLRQISSEINAALFMPFVEAGDFPKQTE